jgi:hypothetical protein
VLALLAPAVTLTVGLLAAYLAFRQIDKQRKNSMELQAKAKRNEFKLEIYREFSAKLDPAQDGLTAVSQYVPFAADEAENAEYVRSRGVTPEPLKSDAKVFSDKFADANIHVTEVIMNALQLRRC